MWSLKQTGVLAVLAFFAFFLSFVIIGIVPWINPTMISFLITFTTLVAIEWLILKLLSRKRHANKPVNTNKFPWFASMAFGSMTGGLFGAFIALVVLPSDVTDIRAMSFIVAFIIPWTLFFRQFGGYLGRRM